MNNRKLRVYCFSLLLSKVTVTSCSFYIKLTIDATDSHERLLHVVCLVFCIGGLSRNFDE